MLEILKTSLLLIFLILSMSTGLAASSDNLNVSTEGITSISKIVNSYFDKLVISSGTNLKEQPVIRGSWSPDSSRLMVEASINSLKKEYKIVNIFDILNVRWLEKTEKVQKLMDFKFALKETIYSILLKTLYFVFAL